MILTYRPIKVWPEGWDPNKPPQAQSPFKSTFAQTIELLDSELYAINASSPTLQVDASDARIRMDGQLHAQASVNYPGVILSFMTPDLGTLVYRCNRFGATTSNDWSTNRTHHRPGWHENLRAIALGLESLRRLERYGIADRGQQYAGWAEIGTGMAMGAKGSTLTIEEAARILADSSGLGVETADKLIGNHSMVNVAYRTAVKEHHPDKGGDPAAFDLLTRAKDLLLEYIAP